MGYQTINVTTITPHIGAEIHGLDLSTPLSNEQFSDVYQAWLDWKVLVFRDQHLDRDQHKAFARRFGKLHVHPMQHSYGGDPEILTVKTTSESKYTCGTLHPLTPSQHTTRASSCPPRRSRMSLVLCRGLGRRDVA